MSITNGYLTTKEAQDYIGAQFADSTGILDDVVTSCSRMIDRHCGRHFYTVTATRLFDTQRAWELELGAFNDLVSVTTLKSDDDGDGVYEVTWTTAQYQLLPIGATARAPEAQPYTKIELFSNYKFPTVSSTRRRGLIQINGSWGWPTAVPVDVKQACRILVAEVSKLQDAPFGVAGNEMTGVQYAPRQMPAAARRLLQPFVHPQHVGIA